MSATEGSCDVAFQLASVTTRLRAGTSVPAERRPSVGYLELLAQSKLGARELPAFERTEKKRLREATVLCVPEESDVSLRGNPDDEPAIQEAVELLAGCFWNQSARMAGG